jgi:DNA-binding CsgD family transcriptional regulator
MKQSARAGCRIQRKNALATKRRSRRDAKRNQIYSNVQEMAPKSVAIVRTEPKLRITPPMQAEIIALFVKGYSLSEISRQTHRARQTVTKICRSEKVQAMIQEQKEKLVAESDAWRESLSFAVAHETDGRLAYKLSEAFGIIPSLSKKAAPMKPQDDWEGIDREKLLKARILGQIAMERASAMRLENDEMEKLAQKDPVESNRSCRLFDNRD